MKKIKKILKNPLFIFVLGGIFFSSIVVMAESINSNEVIYDNSSSLSSATDVQGALDEVFNTLDKVGSGYSLIAHAPEGLSMELVGGLYRYQGATVNNYICFGTTEKNTCTGDTDKYMYQIMGVNEVRQMKLIKKESINGTQYSWNSTSGEIWPNSDLFEGLNGNYFLTNTYYISDSTWSNRIAISTWNYAIISDINIDSHTMYDTEMSAPTIDAKIGLMYLHDYYYGLPGGNNCSSDSICKKSWIFPTNNYNSKTYEWFITRAWRLSTTGTVNSAGSIAFDYPARPVFFLRATERIASGSGTLADPYILS